MQSSTIHRAMCKARKESVRRLVCILTVAALAASAWGLADFWKERPVAHQAGPKVAVGAAGSGARAWA